MANTSRNFVAGKMNKGLDERLLPNGQYIDAVNVRLGSTETTEIGAVENSRGNERLTSIEFNNQPLSNDAICIGAFGVGEEETMYWFVHDPAFSVGNTGKIGFGCPGRMRKKCVDKCAKPQTETDIHQTSPLV